MGTYLFGGLYNTTCIGFSICTDLQMILIESTSGVQIFTTLSVHVVVLHSVALLGYKVQKNKFQP